MTSRQEYYDKTELTDQPVALVDKEMKGLGDENPSEKVIGSLVMKKPFKFFWFFGEYFDNNYSIEAFPEGYLLLKVWLFSLFCHDVGTCKRLYQSLYNFSLINLTAPLKSLR